VQIKAKESVKTIAPYDELPREGGQATDGEDRPTLECGARDQRLTLSLSPHLRSGKITNCFPTCWKIIGHRLRIHSTPGAYCSKAPQRAALHPQAASPE
jgi:hypothetical protein